MSGESESFLSGSKSYSLLRKWEYVFVFFVCFFATKAFEGQSFFFLF